MKVRVGYGLGTRTITNDAARFAALVDALEDLRFDSLWLSEKITDDCPDPIVALAFAAARTSRLKLGTSVLVLPGRNPMLLAKELASLDRLSGGRLLPAFGLGQVDPAEQQAFGVERGEHGGDDDGLRRGRIALERAVLTALGLLGRRLLLLGDELETLAVLVAHPYHPRGPPSP